MSTNTTPFLLIIAASLLLFAMDRSPIPPGDVSATSAERPAGMLTVEEEDALVAEMKEIGQQIKEHEQEIRTQHQGLAAIYEELHEDDELPAELIAAIHRIDAMGEEAEVAKARFYGEHLQELSELHELLVTRDHPFPSAPSISPDDRPPTYGRTGLKEMREETDRIVEYHRELASLHQEMAILTSDTERQNAADRHYALSARHLSIAGLQARVMELIETLYAPYYDKTDSS